MTDSDYGKRRGPSGSSRLPGAYSGHRAEVNSTSGEAAIREATGWSKGGDERSGCGNGSFMVGMGPARSGESGSETKTERISNTDRNAFTKAKVVEMVGMCPRSNRK